VARKWFVCFKNRPGKTELLPDAPHLEFSSSPTHPGNAASLMDRDALTDHPSLHGLLWRDGRALRAPAFPVLRAARRMPQRASTRAACAFFGYALFATPRWMIASISPPLVVLKCANRAARTATERR